MKIEVLDNPPKQYKKIFFKDLESKKFFVWANCDDLKTPQEAASFFVCCLKVDKNSWISFSNYFSEAQVERFFASEREMNNYVFELAPESFTFKGVLR